MLDVRIFNHWLPRFVIINLIFIAAPFAFTQTTIPRLAVLPFDSLAEEEMQKIDIAAMRMIVEEAFLEEKLFVAISPQEMETFFSDNHITPNDIYKAEVKQILSIEGIDYIVSGEVEVDRKGKLYWLRLYMLSVQHSYFIRSKIVELKRPARDIRYGLRQFIKEFVATAEFGEIYAESDVRAALYAVGDTGPAGGIIFYVKPTLSGNWRYLEAAPADIKVPAPWGFYSNGSWVPDIPNTSPYAGDGMQNTVRISEGIVVKNELSAAESCARLSHNGYTDWYLPSKNELELLYRNLALKGIGDFSSASYWSSTQSTASTAWFQRFEDGRQYPDGKKTIILSVRPIRAFR